MTDPRPARPQPLSAASTYLGAIFAIQLVRVLVVVVGVSTPDGQDDVSRQIGWFRTDGASFADAVSVYRIVLTVVAVLAAAGIVFAVYAARGHHQSRVMLTVLAVVLLVVSVSGLAGGDFFGVVIGFAGVALAAQLWTPAVRSWFRVLDGKEPLAVKPSPVKPAQVEPVVDPFDRRPSVVEQPVQAPHVAPPPLPPGPTYGQPSPYPARPGRAPLPKSVSIASWTTLVGSLVVAAGAGMSLLVLVLVGNDYERIVGDSRMMTDLLRDSGMDYDTLRTMSLSIFSICLVLSLGGLLAAWMVLARRSGASVVLFVMTVVTLIVSLLFFPVGIPWTAAAIVVLVQLLKPEAKAWFVRT